MNMRQIFDGCFDLFLRETLDKKTINFDGRDQLALDVYEEGMRQYKKGMSLYKGSAEDYLQRAIDAFHIASELFKEYSPENHVRYQLYRNYTGECCFNTGMAFSRMNQMDRAVNYYEIALGLKPELVKKFKKHALLKFKIFHPDFYSDAIQYALRLLDKKRQLASKQQEAKAEDYLTDAPAAKRSRSTLFPAPTVTSDTAQESTDPTVRPVLGS